MKNRKKHLIYLIIGILALVGLALFITTFDPLQLIDIAGVLVPPIIPFFFLLFVIVSCAGIFILANKRRGILAGVFVASFLLLQYLEFNNAFYTFLLLLIVILLELLFWKKK